MTLYRAAHAIHIGQWRFFPELMIAQNMHNGSAAYFYATENGWTLTCINCPATWMLEELTTWFAKWINGHVVPDMPRVTTEMG